jgi:chemotaxis protein CheD
MMKGHPTVSNEPTEITYASYHLLPGGLFVSPSPHVVTTILGTCVSVTLWDPVKKIGGINHYMLPCWNGEALASPKYGSMAIPKLIERMLRLGSNPRQLQAKLFGGKGSDEVEQDTWMIGKRNVEVAEVLLKEAGIPVMGMSVGGPYGRKILFNTHTGEVMLKYIKM